MTDDLFTARMMLAAEAISSVALSHDPDCECDVCLAANGDAAATVRVLDALDDIRPAALKRVRRNG
jgi:hypothetical protein